MFKKKLLFPLIFSCILLVEPIYAITTHTDVSISAGSNHTCALYSDQSVACWGDNTYGQSIPPSANSFKQISAGENYTCGVKVNNKIACWGVNAIVDVTPTDSFSQVSAGEKYACGIKINKAVTCWGDVTSTVSATLKQVSVGQFHACGIEASGSITCWGQKSLAVDNTPSDGDFTQISAGQSHTCAIKTDGTVICWGEGYDRGTPLDDSFSQISSGGPVTCGIKTDNDTLTCWKDDYEEPHVPLNGHFREIAVGKSHICAIKMNGQVVCEGENESGQSIAPTASFSQVEVGKSHLCALSNSGSVVCLGGSYEQGTPPTDKFNQIAVGDQYSCGIRKDDDKVACWEPNYKNYIVYNDETFKHLSLGWIDSCGVEIDDAVSCWEPDPVTPFISTSISTFSQISVGTKSGSICGLLLSDNQVICNDNAPNPTSTLYLNQISLGEDYACGIEGNLEINCWGTNTKITGNIPDGKFTQISAGQKHACAIAKDASLTCWGSPDENAKGAFIQVSAGKDKSCGIRSDSSLICLGGNSSPYFPLSNKLPEQTVPNSQSMSSVDTLVFSDTTSNKIAITDDAEPDQLLKVTLEATNGYLTLSQTTELTFLEGSGTNVTRMTFEGTAEDINAALDGLSFKFAAITSIPDTGSEASIEITTDDQGYPYAPSFGLKDTDTIVIAVTDIEVNTPPSFTANDPPIVDENSGEQQIVFWATDFNPGGAPIDEGQQIKQYIVSDISNPDLFSILPTVSLDGTLSFTLATDVYGKTTFKVAVQDDGGTDNGGNDTSKPQTFTLIVNPIPKPPIMTPIGDQTVTFGETLRFTTSVTRGTAVRFSLFEGDRLNPSTDDQLLGATIDSLTGEFQWIARQAGIFQITIVAIDGENGLETEETLEITVANSPPVLLPIEDKQIHLGGILIFEAIVDNQENEPLLFSLGNPPKGAVVDSGTGFFTWTPTQVGKFGITLTVRDASGLEDSQTFNVKVDAEPKILPIGDKTITVERTLTFTVNATYADLLTFKLTNSPEGASIDPETGLFSWTPTAKGNYRATIVATDPNEGSSSETIQITVIPAATHLDLVLDRHEMFIRDTLNVSGRLKRFPTDNIDTLLIELQITAPDGTISTTETPADIMGDFSFAKLPTTFDQTGVYLLQAHFAGNEALDESTSSVHAVNVKTLAGYALLVQGRTVDDVGTVAYNKSLNRVYHTMKARGFVDEHIEYLNYDKNQFEINVDDTPSRETIEVALGRLQTKMNTIPAPLYLIMVDHGDANGHFYMDTGQGEHVTPLDLNRWLNHLENNLTPAALAEPRVIVIGTCYSGAFIPTISLPGRIVVTSATESEESYKGPKEPDEVRSGEFFIEALFSQLGRGKSLKTAFELATQNTEILTRINDEDFNEKYQDNAAQHPLLDDNGDKRGSNVVYVGQDGQWAQAVFLGVGPELKIDAADAPAEILRVTPPIFLNVGESTADLFAIVNNPMRVADSVVTVDIRAPSSSLPIDTIEQTEQLEVDNLQRISLTPAGGARFNGRFEQFSEPGRYDILYFVRDSTTGNTSPLKQSSVYKSRANDSAPLPFSLLMPGNGSETYTVVIFSWEETYDPNQDTVSYTLSVATDPQLNQVIYQQADSSNTLGYIDHKTLVHDPLNDRGYGLRDGTEYFWQVVATDEFGSRTESEIFSFTTNDTNAPPSIASFNVNSTIDFSDMENTTIQIDGIIEDTTVYESAGQHLLLVPPGQHTATFSNTSGFDSQSVNLDTQQDLTAQNILLTSPMPFAINYGSLQFTAINNTVQEDTGTVNILVSRLDGTNGAVSVQYTTVEGSAQAGKDYISAKGTLYWSEGDTLSKRITLSITDDNYYEGNETIVLTLFEATGGATIGTPSQTTLTVIDNELQTAPPEPTGGEDLSKGPLSPDASPFLPPPESPPPISKAQLQFAQVSYDVNEATGIATIAVTRTNNLAGEVSVDYAIYPDTATEEDYTPTQGTLTWGDGDDATKTFDIVIIDDTLAETAEKMTLALTQVTGHAQLGSLGQAVLTISDDDKTDDPIQSQAGTLQFAQTYYEAQEDVGEISITVERVTGSEGLVSVNYRALNGDAERESDYMLEEGTLTWEEGIDGEQSFKVTIVNNTTYEGAEQFYLLLSNPTNGALLGVVNPITLTIKESLPDLPLLGQGTALDETGSLRITDAQFYGGIAINGGDYQIATETTRFESVIITGIIKVDPKHRGKTADILIVGSYTAEAPGALTQFYMLDTADNILRWDTKMTNLQAVQRAVTLAETQVVGIFAGHLIASGFVKVYLGYRLPDGTVVYNGEQTIDITILE